jgi:hypothetical protein
MGDLLSGNIGKTLKIMAIICGVIGLLETALGVFGLLLLLVDDDFLIATGILLASGISLCGSSLWMYGFAQAIDDIHAMREKYVDDERNQFEKTVSSAGTSATVAPLLGQAKVRDVSPKVRDASYDAQVLKAGGWKCKCGRVHASYVGSCACGTGKDEV